MELVWEWSGSSGVTVGAWAAVADTGAFVFAFELLLPLRKLLFHTKRFGLLSAVQEGCCLPVVWAVVAHIACRLLFADTKADFCACLRWAVVAGTEATVLYPCVVVGLLFADTMADVYLRFWLLFSIPGLFFE